jgi:hypothetical protein
VLPVPSYLDRYLSGEREQVWADLLALGPAVRDEPVYPDALAVARETMRRVRHNIELLIPRLRDIGYHFYRYGHDIFPEWSQDEADEVQRLEPVYVPPPPDTADLIAAIEQKGGALPISLRTFCEEVGTVNFCGQHPRWRTVERYLDPLEVHSVQIAFEGCDDWGTDDGQYQMSVPVAPDQYGKEAQSGAGPYVIVLGDAAADSRLHGEPHHTTFVNYLRICFRWGGFPGFERVPNPPLADLAYLTAELLPI